MNFWEKLNKPIIGLSPMDGVSDAPFRFITAKYGKPDVITTEFISVDGIAYGAKNLFNDFFYHEIERPVVAQVFGIEPEYFYQASQIICELGFDGVDINMGCPSKTVARRGAGAGLILHPALAREIIFATKEGISDWKEGGLNTSISEKVISELSETKKILATLGVEFISTRESIPVSVKTRIGYDEVQIDEWIPYLLESGIVAITVHGRTFKQMYRGEADWVALSRVGKIVAQYNLDKKTQIHYIANGDIDSPQVARERLGQSMADGLYIGRASYGNPWIFDDIKSYLSGGTELIQKHSLEDIAKVAYEHALLHYRVKGESGFIQMRKHLAWYFRGFAGASRFRLALMETHTPDDVKKIINEILTQ